jgi:hypothetical protein
MQMRGFVAVARLTFVCVVVCLMVAMVVEAGEPAAEVVFLGRAPTLTGIEDVLAKPIRMHFLETPLRDVLSMIQDKAAVAVTVDIEALDDAAIDANEIAVTWRVEDVPLASGLDAVCELLGLVWIVQDDAIEITTPEGAATLLMARMIDVTDITDDPKSLAGLLEAAVQPEAWARNGGPGVITSDETSDASTLIVTNSWQVQRGVAGVVDRLRRCVAAARDERTPSGVGGYWSDAAAAAAARKALATPTTLDVVETPLRDFILEVRDRTGVAVAADIRALDDAACDLDTCTLTGSGRGMRLARLLERLLTPHELTWDLWHDRLTITTPEAARAHHSVALYPLGDLLKQGRNVSKLIDTVQSTVTPDAWDAAGGEAFIRAFGPREKAAPCCLVVLHTSAGHRAVGDFLQQLPR